MYLRIWLISALLNLSGSEEFNKMEVEEEVEVVIVGAGMAGIAAARCLHENGIRDAIILEGSDRIGGRIFTKHFGIPPNSIVEMGAIFIHGGSPENPVYNAMLQRGLLPGKPALLNRRTRQYRMEDGTEVPQDIGLKAYDIFMEIDEEASSYQRPPGTPDITLEDFINNRLNEELMRFSPNVTHMVNAVFNCMKNYLSLNIGDQPDKVSLGEYYRYEEMPGGDVKLPHGYGALVDSLAEDLPSSWIKLNNTVTAIEWEDANHVIVRSSQGQAYRCRFLIITTSVGYLKLHHQALFKPSLPLSKQQAIERIGFGRVDKIFLLFEEPFWDSEEISIGLAFQNRNNNSASRPWQEYISSFVSSYNNPNVLVCLISGEGAEQMEKLPLEEIINELMHILRRFTGNPLIPKPVAVDRSMWCSNPLVNGSYSYHAIGNDGTENQIIAEPLPSAEDPRILFAGEATHNQYFSTVHGAMMTGIREAERILKNSKSKNSK